MASAFRRHCREQADFCARLGAPFTALLCKLLGDRIDAQSPLGRRLDRWPGEPAADALVLRLTGGLHAAVLEGKAPALAALYPPAPIPEADRLWQALEPVLEAPGFPGWLDSPPQTNEVGRSAPLAAGMLEIAGRTGLPLALLELGASAGLNLLPDRYRLELGAMRVGDPAARLKLRPQWEGSDPPPGPLTIATRIGVDRNPLSPVADARRLLAYVWPDQPERLARMRAALAIAAIDPPRVVRADAATFVEAQAHPREGLATTVFHSIAFQYFTAATQARIQAHMERAGVAATRQAPLAWLRYEMEDSARPSMPVLALRLWPDGGDRRLAVGHAHGSVVKWEG